MASDDHSGGKTSAAETGKDAPGWADGLKQLYDSIVEEPLPDTFKDLLDKLDESDESDSDRAGSSGHAGNH